jgi:uncharacterized protein YndB with AHSA1/START domain
MNDESRSIELSVEVPGTPEEVWRAIATGPGIGSWYVPHVVEEREGGAAHASFGDAPEMQIPGRVAAWEPPRRIVFTGEDAGGMAFEWLVEARDDGTCIVRLVNSGFGNGDDWDAQYDGMSEGWKLFFLNLRLHMEHFAGQTATSMLPMASWAGSRADVWARLTSLLGIPAAPAVGERISVDPTSGAPAMAGTVVEAESWRLALVLDAPAPGTAFIAVEGDDSPGVSVWSYLYGPGATGLVEEHKPAWQRWLDEHAGDSGSGA